MLASLCSGLPEAMSWRDASHVIPCAPRRSLPSDVDVVDLQPTSPVTEIILCVTCNKLIVILLSESVGFSLRKDLRVL